MTGPTQPNWLSGFVPNPAKGNPLFVRGGPSPNPAGKPKGITDKRAKLMRQIMDEASEVVDALLAKAKEGDSAAGALIMNRILPALRSQSQCVQFDLDPSLPLSEQLAQLAIAVASGQVSPDVGQQISAMLSNLASVKSSEQLEERIIALEDRAVN